MFSQLHHLTDWPYDATNWVWCRFKSAKRNVGELGKAGERKSLRISTTVVKLAHVKPIHSFLFQNNFHDGGWNLFFPQIVLSWCGKPVLSRRWIARLIFSPFDTEQPALFVFLHTGNDWKPSQDSVYETKEQRKRVNILSGKEHPNQNLSSPIPQFSPQFGGSQPKCRPRDPRLWEHLVNPDTLEITRDAPKGF